jgi:ABC-type bacteriocin/lantibiotic exporter with double-glycine peptidase domain
MWMTSAQLILVSVTSAIVAVIAMLVVATFLRARGGDDEDEES